MSWLLIYGELPTPDELPSFKAQIRKHTMLHEDFREFFGGFPTDAHPMAVLSSAVSALSTFYQDSLDPFDHEHVEMSTIRLMAKMPTIAAYAYKKSVGQPFLYPDNTLGYVDNFLRMTFGVPAEEYVVNPVASKALNLLFLLHADHEQNCSTSTVRLVGSSNANLFVSVAAGVSALFGPLHGGANQAVLEMLEGIQADGGDVARFVQRVKDKEPGVKLMGFGHRVYKNYDPRAALVKKVAADVLASLDKSDPLLDLAMQLEEVALADDYFVERKLYPNVDFYTGVIYKALGFPTRMFTVLFALGPAARLDRAVARDDRGPGDEDRPAPPGLHRPGGAAPALGRRDGPRAPGPVAATRPARASSRSSSAAGSSVSPACTGPACTTVLRGAVSQRKRCPRLVAPAGPSPAQVRASASSAPRTPSTSTCGVERPQPGAVEVHAGAQEVGVLAVQDHARR